MSAVKELIRAAVDGTLEFGDYTLDKNDSSYTENKFKNLNLNYCPQGRKGLL